ncbi:MAG TPA: hypothetical protein PLN56_09965 [Methanoregulaceae archaeon]|nr:hypothetical protein [Sedimentisphaerales bacterium]HPD11301.1 hypothetical protein [Methanoregulaceae archaeon]HRT52161.1 hypothetical protein [Anaerohalosphaeraceae bacterium]
MRKITKICKGRMTHTQIKDAESAIEDAIEMAMEQVEATIAKVRSKDNAIEWRAACDEILDRLREEF